MGVLAVIPARGGSKGLPRKNVRLLCGRPLIAWTIEAAQRAETVDRVVVSTDDGEIAGVSRQWGAEVVWRPAEISGDTAPSEAALLHALEQLGVREGTLAFLQCTAPLMLPEDIDGTVRAAAGADVAFTASPWHGFLWQDGPEGPLPVGHDKVRRPMRQERQGLYREVGAVYAMGIEGFLRARHRFFGRTVLYPIPPERAVEIDDETDFAVAEALMTRRLRRERAARLPRPVRAVIADFDGVLTDNRVAVDGAGQETVVCHRGDGWAVARLQEAGVRVLVLTQEEHPAVRQRCRKLAVECIVARGPKLPLLQAWLDRWGIDARSAVYVGNDEPDVPCMGYVGCGVAPQDAYPQARRAAQIVLEAPGGRGCLRELAALILGDEEGLYGTAAHRG
ncbi:MAG: acylneuraminate cytidylyltransferase [Symbiobacteriaceae bacterium]